MYKDSDGSTRLRRGNNSGKFDQNIGRPGVVYILANRGLAPGWYKIGCTRYSGDARADSLNRDASTGTPGEYYCVFECRSEDCGTAEVRVFQELNAYRRGKWGQEFFEVDVGIAKATIERVCAIVDSQSNYRPRASSNLRLTPNAYTGHSAAPAVPASHYAQRNSSDIGSVTDVEIRIRPKKGRRSFKLWIMIAVIATGLYWLYRSTSPHEPVPASSVARASVPGSNKPVKQPKTLTSRHPPTKTADGVISSSSNVTSVQLRPTSLSQTKNTTALSSLTDDERQSLESTCERDGVRNNQSSKEDCFAGYLKYFDANRRPANLGVLNATERQSLEYACSHDKYSRGPVAYNDCRSRLLANFDVRNRPSNMDRFSEEEKRRLDFICSQDKFVNGPVAYNACMTRALQQIETSQFR